MHHESCIPGHESNKLADNCWSCDRAASTKRRRESLRNSDLLIFLVPGLPVGCPTYEKAHKIWFGREYLADNQIRGDLSWYYGDSYVLTAGVYFANDHFVTLMLIDNIIYAYDGMVYTGPTPTFWDVLPTGKNALPKRRPFVFAFPLKSNLFPLRYDARDGSSYWLETLFWVRKETM